MTDLILNDESKQYQDLAKDFSQNEIAPKSEFFDHSSVPPTDIWKKAWEIGLVNVQLPEAFGGLGLGLLDATIIAEELAAGCVGISAAFWGNDLAVAPLLVAGTIAQQEKFLKPLMNEFSVAGYCFETSSNVQVKRNGMEYVLSGDAVCINATQAPWLVMTALSIEGKKTVFVIEKNAKGVSVGEPTPKMGLTAADIRLITLNHVSATAEQMLGEADQGTKLMEQVRVQTAPTMAAYATGLARAAMEHAIKYSKERFTFGVPIANHQGVGFMLADMSKGVEAARLLTHKAAWLVDNGAGNFSQSLTALHFATEIAMSIATDAVQVYGGYGYSREYPVEKLMRDAKTMQVLEAQAVNDRLTIGLQLVAGCST